MKLDQRRFLRPMPDDFEETFIGPVQCCARLPGGKRIVLQSKVVVTMQPANKSRGRING